MAPPSFQLPGIPHFAADIFFDPVSDSSYRQILKSSSIIGGAQAINYIIGLLRIKVVAVLLGPSGVGLVGLYVSVVGLVQTFAQFGINESGVREVAVAAGGKDEQKIAQMVKTLRRTCWFTGIFGWVLTVALAWPLSQWVFGSTDHVWALAILGSVVLLELVSGGQKALLQGFRRVGDLARIQIAFALLSTLLAIGIYWWLREDGIVPVIILTSVVQLGVSWWFARKVSVSAVTQPWRQTWRNSKKLFQLGSAFMYGALLAGIVGLAIRALIVRDLGIEAAGIYQAAWALSGMFGAFVLQAMGTDFYPRLTASASINTDVNRLVNEQIEVGMLMTLPGVLGAIVTAPWLIALFYSEQFLPSQHLLPWFAIGVFVQVVTWPLGMIQRAKGAALWMFVGQTHLNCLSLILVVAGLPYFGLAAVGWAFVLAGIAHGFLVRFIAWRLSQYRMAGNCIKILVLSAASICLGFVLESTIKGPVGTAASMGLFFLTSLLCVRSLLRATGPNSRVFRLIMGIPGAGLLLR